MIDRHIDNLFRLIQWEPWVRPTLCGHFVYDERLTKPLVKIEPPLLGPDYFRGALEGI